MNNIIRFFIHNRLVTVLFLAGLIVWGLATAPFDWETGLLMRDPVPVDAIPNIGDNQQIVFTNWPGRSPEDVEDQITYPLTTSLLGLPGVKSVRSNSMFGFSSIYIIFEEGIEFYWSRSRILEKLNSLSPGLLPDGVQPNLGPDATALGQIYWYTLEGRTPDGEPAPGWDPQELRRIQDFYVKYSLNAVQGVSEVASIGGFVQEYQINLKPDNLQMYNITLAQVIKAVRESNLDVGAKTLEINRVEYFIRGLGYVKSLEDLENSVVVTRDNTPILLKDIARIQMGPATRRGALDKTGAEAVGGVVIARFGDNPMQVIERTKEQIAQISGGLPKKTLEDGTISQVTIVPFYDRSNLINETLGTLEEALTLEVIITIMVVLVMVRHIRTAFTISALLPIAILLCFIAMRYTGVEANIVALSGIAIAIGTMVDLGIILSENILQHMQENKGVSLVKNVTNASLEVASAIVTAVSTTIISFIPVFALQGEEGKLFGPLAFTKTYALAAALLVTLLFLPTIIIIIEKLSGRQNESRQNLKKLITSGRLVIDSLFLLAGIYVALTLHFLIGVIIVIIGTTAVIRNFKQSVWLSRIELPSILVIVGIILAGKWMPLGADHSLFTNFIFIAIQIGSLLGLFWYFLRVYPKLLKFFITNNRVFLSGIVLILLLALTMWKGINFTFGWAGDLLGARETAFWEKQEEVFPGIGK